MESGHSESSVYYQAVPAFGADGKNVLKLIPVKMVNGQFFQAQISKPRMESTTQSFMRVSSTPHQMKTAVTPSATEQTVTKKLTVMKGFPSQVGLVPSNLVSNPPPQQQTVYVTAPFATNSPGRPRQLPVTVKSPVLPRGQLIQIPPNAQVRTVPASELPVGVKKQIFKSSVKGSDEPTVIYVSPVTTVIQAAAPAQDSALHTLKPPLKLIPKASNRPNGPTRWVIEEEGCTKAQSHNPPSAPLIPHILNAVKKTEKAGQQHCEVNNGAASESSLGKSSCDALVMCNGKMFFVAEKRSLPDEMGESKLNKTVDSTVQQTVEQATSQTCQNMSVITPHEVIDLCDDDGQEDSIPISHQEDDNVIFVSYIPPKSEARSVQASRRSDKMNTSHSDSVSGGAGEVSTEVSKVTENKESNVMTQHSTSTLQLGEMRDEVEAGTPADLSNCDGSSATHTQDESSLSPDEREMADHQLRKMFEIRSDVKIHLQRIDEAPAELVLTESVSSESDHQSQESDTCRSGKGVTQEDQSADITPLQHSPFKLNSHSLPAVENCPSGAVTETLCGVGNAPVINYVEPIDEDFLISSNEDTADQGQAQNTNTRRIVRTRKRTMCPCCIPGSLEPAMKYKVDDLGKWTCGTQQTGKKGTQKKTARKGGTTPGNGFITSRSKQVTVRDGLSTASMHSELKSHKHMKRVK
ncbi:ligand-dependent nuclear receptor-interacting factor 1 [Solea senegalensis]|uniref:Ligand-dependent nuclear receptor-interacting factor 1 n=1 Tax=Solea senegalensis TaxID=28829 RepID=A0AAV6SRG1_SOLSE|nr:ligand-dependent nuclear receptor-interacting factor 1 [Solea senegalensis]KAG7520143.1 ligand-dependent nuclear receptor-interacting factor 1 [Solea senegalensis]